MKGYIYIVTNQINGMQYVGQTYRTIEQRFKQHQYDAMSNNRSKTLFHEQMYYYGVNNFIVQKLDEYECDDKCELLRHLNDMEIYYIEKYNTLCPNGYNSTRGGMHGVVRFYKKIDEYDVYGNYIQTHESIISASESVEAQTPTAILKCCKGRSKFAFGRIWRYHGDAIDKYPLPHNPNVALRDYKKTPVDQYDYNGNLINSYDSIISAIRELNITSSDHITECCKGKLYTCYGYVWRYHGEPFDKYKSSDKRFKGCRILSKNGDIIGEFRNISDAIRSVGLDPKKTNPHIISCCKGLRNTAYGYKWQYI